MKIQLENGQIGVLGNTVIDIEQDGLYMPGVGCQITGPEAKYTAHGYFDATHKRQQEGWIPGQLTTVPGPGSLGVVVTEFRPGSMEQVVVESPAKTSPVIQVHQWRRDLQSDSTIARRSVLTYSARRGGASAFTVGLEGTTPIDPTPTEVGPSEFFLGESLDHGYGYVGTPHDNAMSVKRQPVENGNGQPTSSDQPNADYQLQFIPKAIHAGRDFTDFSLTTRAGGDASQNGEMVPFTDIKITGAKRQAIMGVYRQAPTPSVDQLHSPDYYMPKEAKPEPEYSSQIIGHQSIILRDTEAQRSTSLAGTLNEVTFPEGQKALSVDVSAMHFENSIMTGVQWSPAGFQIADATDFSERGLPEAYCYDPFNTLGLYDRSSKVFNCHVVVRLGRGGYEVGVTERAFEHQGGKQYLVSSASLFEMHPREKTTNHTGKSSRTYARDGNGQQFNEIARDKAKAPNLVHADFVDVESVGRVLQVKTPTTLTRAFFYTPTENDPPEIRAAAGFHLSHYRLIDTYARGDSANETHLTTRLTRTTMGTLETANPGILVHTQTGVVRYRLEGGLDDAKAKMSQVPFDNRVVQMYASQAEGTWSPAVAQIEEGFISL